MVHCVIGRTLFKEYHRVVLLAIRKYRYRHGKTTLSRYGINIHGTPYGWKELEAVGRLQSLNIEP